MWRTHARTLVIFFNSRIRKSINADVQRVDESNATVYELYSVTWRTAIAFFRRSVWLATSFAGTALVSIIHFINPRWRWPCFDNCSSLCFCPHSAPHCLSRQIYGQHSWHIRATLQWCWGPGGWVNGWVSGEGQNYNVHFFRIRRSFPAAAAATATPHILR